MSKCVYCLKEIGESYQECPFCGFPVSVPFTVKNVKQKWKQDMYTKSFKIDPSLDAMHRAEKAEQEGGQQQQRDRQPQRPPQRPPQQNRPHPQQPWGQPPQYPQAPGGYPAQPGYGYPAPPTQYSPQYPQYPQYPQAPQTYPNANQNWNAASQQPEWGTPTQPLQSQQPVQPSKPQQAPEKPPIPNHTAPPKQPQPARAYDAELFNDWLT